MIKKIISTTTVQIFITALTFLFGVLMAIYSGSSTEMYMLIYTHLKMVFGFFQKLFCPSITATRIWFFEKPKTKSVLVYMLFTRVHSKVILPYIGEFSDNFLKKRIVVAIIHFNNVLFLGIVAIFFLSANIFVHVIALSLDDKKLLFRGLVKVVK